MDVSYVYFLGVFGSRLVLILVVCPKSPSSETVCLGVLGMFADVPSSHRLVACLKG
jgi:hypothetical protein